ncbi:MAG TPA: hypothetical protein VHE30_22350 [Polyangiaceae bacterium]|nr:hypothetical protein [Polyangiaceae bacterium]
MTTLAEKILTKSPGVCLYGITPPKRAISDEALRTVVEAQLARISGLGADGLVVYDIEDESSRTDVPRPFPFLPTIDAATYADSMLSDLGIPKIIYRPVARFDRATFESTLRAEAKRPDERFTVLVGAPSRAAAAAGISLGDACRAARDLAPSLVVGGIAIAERHGRGFAEHDRIIAKMDQGCRFFVTQAVYDVTATKSLISDLAIRLERDHREPVPVVVTFSPCGSVKTLDFMQWLGIAFPRWLENDLRRSRDILEASVALAIRIGEELFEYAREHGIPLGINVESVSVRKAEIDASVALFGALARSLRASPPPP